MDWKRDENKEKWEPTEEEYRENDRRLIGVLVILLLLTLAVLMSGCKTIKEVPVEVIKERVEYIDHIQYDSIYKHDSIYIRSVGDTICIYKDKYIYKYQFVHDTTFVCKTDSIPYTIEVEKELSRYDKFKMDVGGATIPFFIIVLCVGVGYVIKKFV